MALHLIVSNSAQKLAEHFRDEIYLKRAEEDIFVPETVIVQSQGMGVWLTQQLSDPIAANLDTPFLNSFTDGILTRFFPDETKPLMTEDRMFWQIFGILLSDLKAYPELARYVTGENRNLKACQLAEKTAALYDRYQMYHPELLEKWRSGSVNSWQARLFLQLCGDA
ncbi:MAG: exonuclease V subunit gamma, partial [Lentisphaerae bacterium]|nr:exonuclease V subunit gamma [Lentisphaerota bacterium]